MAAGEGYPDRRSLSRRLRRYPAFGRDETTIRRHDGLAAAPFGAFRTYSGSLRRIATRWEREEPLIFNPVAFVDLVIFMFFVSDPNGRRIVVSSCRRLVVSSRPKAG